MKFELFRSSAERSGAVPGSAEHLEGYIFPLAVASPFLNLSIPNRKVVSRLFDESNSIMNVQPPAQSAGRRVG